MAEFAIEDLNEKCGGLLGRPVELVQADDKSDPATNGAATAVQVLNQGAVVLMTICDYDFGAPAQSTAQDRGIPAVSTCAGAPQFGENGLGPLTFSAGIATPNEAAVPAEWAYGEQGWRSVYVLNDPTIDYDTTYCNAFKTRWEDLGGTVVGEDQFNNSDLSIQSQITRLKGASPSPDFILLCSYSPGGGSAIRQLRAAGVDLPIVTGVGLGGDYWFEAVPNLSDLWQTGYGSWKGDDESELINDMTRRWEEQYGTSVPVPHAYMGYEAVQMIAAAIAEAGSTDPEAITEALTEITFPGVLGEHILEPGYNLSFTLPVTIMEVQDGEAAFEARQAPEINTVTLLGSE